MIWLVACSAPALRYEPVDFSLGPDEVGDRETLDDEVAAMIGTRRLRAWSSADERAFDELPDEALYAMWATSLPLHRGAELDLWVDAGDGRRAITLWWGLDRSVHVAIGPAGGAPEAGGGDLVDADALATEVGMGGFVGDWPAEDAWEIAQALSLLTEAERRAVGGVTLRRGADSPRAPTRELAFFDPQVEPPALWFFDVAFGVPDGFVGPPEAPVAPAAMTALHEIGHVVADVPFRRAYVAYTDAYDVWRVSPDEAAEARREEMHERYAAYRRIRDDGPVIAAWEAFRAGRRGPSTYGWRDAQESFAEAFALYHLDPEALDRVMPGAVAWFVAGTHTRAAGLGE